MAVVRVKTEANLMSLDERHRIFSQNGTRRVRQLAASRKHGQSELAPACKERAGQEGRAAAPEPTSPPHSSPTGPRQHWAQRIINPTSSW